MKPPKWLFGELDALLQRFEDVYPESDYPVGKGGRKSRQRVHEALGKMWDIMCEVKGALKS